MKITCAALSKNTGKSHTLVHCDLSKIDNSDENLMSTGETGVTISVDKRGLTMDGDYIATIQLTRKDVAIMAGKVFEKEPFGKVIQALSVNC